MSNPADGSAPEHGRAPAILSIHIEDELRLERQRAGVDGPGDPSAVEQRLEAALGVLAEIGATATFFAEGRLVAEIARSWWPTIVAKHELGSVGLSRTIVGRLGPSHFADDARRGREALEEAAGVSVTAFRAPEFSAEGADPWFGEGLVAAGYRVDASRRLAALPPEAEAGHYPLEGTDGAIVELPLAMLPANLPFAGPRVMFLGSAAFRMLPLPTIRVAFELAQQQGFVPQVVLGLGDLEGGAGTPGSHESSTWRRRIDQLWRNAGRGGVVGKLQQLSWRWSFDTIAASLR